MKKFKLNHKQELMIFKNHKLYSDILIASLIDQNINNIIAPELFKQGYRKNYIHNSLYTVSAYYYVWDKPSKIIESIICLF